MTLSATYNDDLGRVQISFTGANTDADYAKVERSLDGITWQTVRGGDFVPITAGAGHLDDYEFAAGVSNQYRATYVDSAPVTQFGVGAVAQGNNATLNPALPAGTIPTGALMLLFVSHQNTAADITVTGWTRMTGLFFSNYKVYYRFYVPGDTAPSVVFTGGASGNSCTAFIRVFLNGAAPENGGTTSNTTPQQNIPTSASTTSLTNAVWVLDVWKQSASTGASLPPNFTDPQGVSNTAGANAETHFNWMAPSSLNLKTVPSGVVTMTGGTTAISRAYYLRVAQRSNVGVETASVTPVLDSVWLKNPSRPSLNTKVDVVDVSEITRPTRTGIFDVIGRTYPIAVSDVQGSRRLTLTVRTTYNLSGDMDNRLATGEPMFLQAPSNAWQVPTMYVIAGDVTMGKSTSKAHMPTHRLFTIPLTEVAAPGSTISGDTITWLDVTTTYASWNSVIAAKTTWSNLIDSISTGTVIVP